MNLAQDAADFEEVQAFVGDPRVAAALQKWARGRGGTIHVPDIRWSAEGFSGARLFALDLDTPGGP